LKSRVICVNGFARAEKSPLKGQKAARIFMNHPVSHQPAAEPGRWTAREFAMAFACVLLAWLAAALRWPLADMVVPWDSKNHFYPMLRHLGAAFANGEWPLWNPFHFSGHPTVADPQSLLFNPTMLLLAWLAPDVSMQVFDLVVFAHLLIAGLATIGLFARRGWAWQGAVLAAVVVMLGGSAAGRLQHTGMILSYSLFPLAWLLLELMLARRSILFAILFGIVAAAMAVGRDQVAFLCCLTLIGLAAADLLGDARPWQRIRSRLPVLVVAGATGAALLAVPALLTLQLLSGSSRPQIGYGVAVMGSLPPQSLATLLMPDIFGSLRWSYDYWGPSASTLAEGTWTDRSIQYVYAGLVPIGLILALGLVGGRLIARDIRAVVVVGLVATIYALGHYTPLFEWAFDLVPGVSLYRRPADATFLVNVAVGIASGWLLHGFIAGGLPARALRDGDVLGPVMVALAIVGAALALAAGLHFAMRAGQGPVAAREIAVALAGLAALLLLLRLGDRRPHLRPALAVLLVAVGSADLVMRNAAASLNAEPSGRYAVFEQLPPDQLRGLRKLKAELAERNARGERPRVEILGLPGAWQNAAMVLGIEDTLGYNPLRLSDYERVVGPGENAAEITLRQFPRTFRGYGGRMASLLGLEYLVIDRPIETLPRHFPRFESPILIHGEGRMWIYRLQIGAPRAYFATRLLPVDCDRAIRQGRIPAFEEGEEALIATTSIPDVVGDHGLRDPATRPDAANASVRIRGYRRNAVILTVETNRPGVLVLHDLFYPGWQVFVDGERRPVLRVNLLFRGVELDPGRHRIEFRFRPLTMDNLVAAAGDILERRDHDQEASATP
jgi:hypothetical protein